MVNFGQYPLVYQLQNGLPVGLAETSSLGSFSAVNLVVSSITADNYLIGGNPASFNFTGVVAVLDATGTGISLVDNSNSNYPKIRPLTSNTNNFVTFSQNVNNVEINYGTNPLSYAHGGTNSVTTPYTNSVAYWNGSNQLITNSEFTFDESNLNIPPGGNYKIAGNQITLSDLANIDSPQTLENIPAPTTANTYLVYNGTGINWSAVTGTGGTSITIPTTPGRIPYVVNSTTLGEVGWLSIETGTGRFNVCNVYADGAVCAVVIQENGQTLSTKYQAKDDTLTTIASLNPTTNQFIYFINTNVAATATVSPCALELLNDSTFADMRTTLQLNTYYQPTGLYLTAIPSEYLTQTEADGIYQPCNVFLTTLATNGNVELDSADVVNTLPVTNGGTGNTTFNDKTVVFYDSILSPPRLTGDTSFKFENNTLKSPNVCATTVCATTFQEGGINLSTKYQGYDSFLTDLSTQDTVNLASQVCGTLPILNGGTSKTSFNNDQLIYGQFSQDSNLTFISNSLRSPAVCATTVCATTFNEAGTNLSSKYLSITDAANTYTPLTVTGLFETTANAQNTYLTKSNFGTWSGALALSAGLLDVQITSPSPGQVLKWTGSNWINDTDATGTGGTTSPVGPEGAVQYKSGAGGFTGVGSFIFNQASALLATNSVSAGVFYAAGTGQLKTPKSNYVYYGSPAATTFNGVTYPKGYVTQDQNGEFWFSSNAVISGATQPGPSSTLFVRRVCVGGTQTTTNNIGVVFGRFATNPGIGPGYDPVDLDPPEFLTLTGTANYLTYMDSGGTLSYASAMSVYKKNGSLSSSPDTLQINGTLITEILSSTVDATIDNDLVVLGNGQVLGTLEAGTVSATNYYNLPSSTITWLNAYNAQTIRKYVKNSTGATIPKGRPVTVIGATGDNTLVAPLSSVNTHVPEAVGLSNHVFGLTETQILNDNFGYIITEGIVSGTGGGVNALDTSLFAAGDILYVSSNGLLTNTRPTPPYESHPVGFVIRSQSNNGSIYVKIETQPEINDIVGFNLASSLVNGDLITYDLTTSTFVNKQSIDVTGLIKGGSVSATTYLNLPSGTATWNANKIQSVSVCATAPSRDNQLLAYDLVANSWKAGLAVSSGSGAPAGGVDGDIYIQYFDTVDVPTDASSLRGYQITSTAPVNNNILRYNGTAWVPSASAILQSVSAASYLNYPSTQAAGTVAGAIQLNNGTNTFDADDAFYYAAKVLHISEGAGGELTTDVATISTQLIIDTATVTSPATQTLLITSSLRVPTVSATTYLNLPSGVATWNASALRGFTVSSTTPTNNRVLTYVSAASAWNPQPLPAEIGVACSDETTNLTSGTAKATFRMPYAMTLTSVRANVNTAPVGSTILVDVNKNGASIFSTRVSIDASEKTSVTAASAFVLSTTSLADDDEITVDIDQVGSSTAGKGLKIWLIGTRA